MSSDIAISVHDLTKTYRIFSHPSDRIKQAITFGKLQFHKDFTALRNISFEIEKGETIGIIGRNGSGKSTLLQIICGILRPSSGSIEVKGRISALLELGAGFNPEFTGRENVYFQGTLMGLTKAEIDEKFDDIARFADIGEFLDQPVRIYSSGMFVRLAFSVAVHVDPEILIVDEALAVGDASFRSQCFRRIAQLRDNGCTILSVSHAMDQIISTCNRSILLDEGELLMLGNSKSIAEYYQGLMGRNKLERQVLRDHLRMAYLNGELPQSTTFRIETESELKYVEAYNSSTQSETTLTYAPNGAVIEAVQILTTAKQRVNQLLPGETYLCTYQAHFTHPASSVRFAMLVRTSEGIIVGGAWSATSPLEGLSSVPKGTTVKIEFEFKCLLTSGLYAISTSVTGSAGGIEYTLHGVRDAEAFSVISKRSNATIGSTDLSCKATIHICESIME